MNKTPDAGRVLRLARDITIDHANGTTVVTVPATGRLLFVNPTALCVIDLLQKGATRAAIVAQLRARFASEAREAPDEGRVALDVDRCLFELAGEGLLDHAAL